MPPTPILARLAVASLVLAACARPDVPTSDGPGLPTGPATGSGTPVEAPDAHAEARARWDAAALAGYEMTITRSCFCPPEWRGPYRAVVEGGAVASVLREGAPVDAAATPPTVDELFALLDAAYAEGAARVEATYHEALGYPVSLYIDRDERIADEEVGYSVSELIRR